MLLQFQIADDLRNVERPRSGALAQTYTGRVEDAAPEIAFGVRPPYWAKQVRVSMAVADMVATDTEDPTSVVSKLRFGVAIDSGTTIDAIAPTLSTDVFQLRGVLLLPMLAGVIEAPLCGDLGLFIGGMQPVPGQDDAAWFLSVLFT